MNEMQGLEDDEREDAAAATRAMVDWLAGENFRTETRAIGRDRWLVAGKVFLAAWFRARAARIDPHANLDDLIPF